MNFTPNILMKLHLLFVIALFLVLPVQAQTTNCDDFESRFGVGFQGRVAKGDANNVRNAPSADAGLVGQIIEDTKFIVLDGPVCANGFTWWQIESLDGLFNGWTVEGSGDEYWLIPGWLGYSADEFSIDYTPIANNVMLETISPDPVNYSVSFPDGAPDYLLMTFEDTVVNEYLTPQVTVIPVDFFVESAPELYQSLLYYHESLYSETPSTETIVLLPKLNAAMVHFSHAELIELESVRGYRYVAQFSQYPAPIRGTELAYHFAGMTEDGSHFISAILPLSSIAQDIFYIDLSESETISNDAGVLPEYGAMLSTHASELQSDEFYPSLETLDAVIASIVLGENADLPEALENRPSETLVITVSDPITFVSDFTGGFFTAQYDLYADSDAPYMSVFMVNEADLYGERMFYEAWRSVVALFDTALTPQDIPSASVLLGDYDLAIGEIEQIETDTLKGIRFIASVRDQVKYMFWGVTPNNSFITVQSDIKSNEVSDEIIAERDAIIADFSFEVR